MAEFRFDEDDSLDRKELVEDLRDQFEVCTDLWEQLKRQVEEYNRIVSRAEAFVSLRIEEAVDSLESRTEKFQESPRGEQIKMWIEELREFTTFSRTIQLPQVTDLDPDLLCAADKLEDLSEKA